MTSKRSDSPTTSLAAGTIGPDAGAEVAGHIEEIAEMTPEFAAKPARSRTALSRNKELARAEKMRREFSANVSHEMKTPLQVISGYAELMANGLVPPEDVPRFAQLIYEEAQAMRALIDDVLVLSRLDEVAPAAEEATAVDIAVVAHHVVQRLAKLAADAEVTVALRTDPVIIQGNETLLEQMIYNLVENAIRYNREEGRVFVEVYEEDTAVIRVNDTGAGIPADKLEKIFERFYRLEKSRSKELGGTGLGLAIVKHAALYHGGDVTVESEEDAGTRFTVRLPLS
ncbi:ATP-binding protein [Adlercreutzia sp. R25]|uniref:sensor histidine kinase n=1 Tax=Adlercreutzia shanghongiae TaxID=3111773 RepID=UPI002DB69532|nr:ATP-binding protein [Adlercreutzia sp. R25]MEC4271980.1 ATP-binding protein [Adlercreutzia sp. R25]